MVQLQGASYKHIFTYLLNLSMYAGFFGVFNVSEFRHGISRHHEHQAQLWIELLRY
jgi:hypothetical protein